MGIGCQNPVPLPIEPTNVPSNIVPTYDIEPSKPVGQPSLHIIDAEVYSITEHTGVLSFKTNHLCTAIVKLIAWEREVALYNLDDKAESHSQFFNNLHYATDYSVIIEATGSSSDRKVLQFTTLYSVPIRSVISNGAYHYGWASSTCNGVLSAEWNHGDGSFSSNIWTVQAKAGEAKHCYFLIRNQTPQNQVVQVQASINAYITISGSELPILACSDRLYEITMATKGYAPPSVYSIVLSFTSE
jgi:hypothetical protein